MYPQPSWTVTWCWAGDTRPPKQQQGAQGGGTTDPPLVTFSGGAGVVGSGREEVLHPTSEGYLPGQWHRVGGWKEEGPVEQTNVHHGDAGSRSTFRAKCQHPLEQRGWLAHHHFWGRKGASRQKKSTPDHSP